MKFNSKENLQSFGESHSSSMISIWKNSNGEYRVENSNMAGREIKGWTLVIVAPKGYEAKFGL